MEDFRMDPHACGEIAGDQGGDHTGHQSGVIHDAHAHHFHCENSRRHRRSKKRRKSRAHAAHDHDVPVFLVQGQPPAQLVSDASTQLDHGSLAAGRTAGEMGQRRGDKDQWSRAKGHIVSRCDRGKDLIGSSIILPEGLIQKDNDQAGHRKQEKYPTVFLTEAGHCCEHKSKKCAGSSHHTAGQNRKEKPFSQACHIFPDLVQIKDKALFQFFFHVTFLFSYRQPFSCPYLCLLYKALPVKATEKILLFRWRFFRSSGRINLVFITFYGGIYHDYDCHL